MAPFLYKTGSGPRYILGHAVSLAMIGFATCVYGFMWFWLRAKNKRRALGREDYKVEGKTEEEAKELGDENPSFMFTY